MLEVPSFPPRLMTDDVNIAAVRAQINRYLALGQFSVLSSIVIMGVA